MPSWSPFSFGWQFAMTNTTHHYGKLLVESGGRIHASALGATLVLPCRYSSCSLVAARSAPAHRCVDSPWFEVILAEARFEQPVSRHASAVAENNSCYLAQCSGTLCTDGTSLLFDRQYAIQPKLVSAGHVREENLKVVRCHDFITPITPFGWYFRQTANSQWFSMARIPLRTPMFFYFQSRFKFPSWTPEGGGESPPSLQCFQ